MTDDHAALIAEARKANDQFDNVSDYANKMIQRLADALEAVQQTPAVDREALARALDPWAWHTGDPSNGAVQVSRAESLAKAQTIIARLSASGILRDVRDVQAAVDAVTKGDTE